MSDLQPGITNELTWMVEERHLVSALSDEGPRVFSTPMLTAISEDCARTSVDSFLPEGQFTVGTRVDIRHLAATPPGMRVTARSELLEVDGRRLRFRIETFDDEEKVGECEHERFIVNESRFYRRLDEKLRRLQEHPE